MTPRPRILVFNDTEDILELFQEILGEAGYETITSSYARCEVEEIEKVKPDVVILDYIMYGEKWGWELLQKIKLYRPTALIPIIVCTGATAAVRETEGYMKAKGVELVFKPFDIDDLERAVKRALALPETLAHLREPEEHSPRELAEQERGTE